MAIDGAVANYNENAGSVYNARELRRQFDKLLGWDVRTVGGTATSGIANGGVARYYGVATTGDLAVIQRAAGANMSVDVLTGGAMVGGTENALQGEYFVFNDASVNVAITNNSSGNPRIDVIGIQIRDTEYSGATDDARILVITGTAAGVPAVPTLPADFLTLAHVAVASGAGSILTANITDKRVNLTSLGGVVVADSDTTLPTVNVWKGMVAFVRTSATAGSQPALYANDGAAWNALGQYSRSWTIITDAILGSDTTISLTSIPQTFAHLRLTLTGRGNAAVANGAVLIRVNGDTGANYDEQHLQANAGAVAGAVNAATTSWSLFSVPGTTGTANKAGSLSLLIPDYRSTTFHKTLQGIINIYDPGVLTLINTYGMVWRSTAAITQIDPSFNAIGTGWKAGTRYTLEGIR